jgi:hypothetical protein
LPALAGDGLTDITASVRIEGRSCLAETVSGGVSARLQPAATTNPNTMIHLIGPL